MKIFSGFLGAVAFVFGMMGLAHALPIGDYDYILTTDNPLRLEFNNLAGAINYQLWLETEPTASGAWDAYYRSFWEQESGGNIILNLGGIYFNESDSSWRDESLFDTNLTGSGWLRIELQDLGSTTNPVAYLRNFDSAPVSGQTPVPEPATMLLICTGLAGFGVFRKKFRRSS